MQKMIVCRSQNFVRDFDAEDIQVFVSEGTPVIVFDDDFNNPEDFVSDYEEVPFFY